MPPKISTLHKQIESIDSVLEESFKGTDIGSRIYKLIQRVAILERDVKLLLNDNKSMQNELIKLTDPDCISPSKKVVDELYSYQQIKDKYGNK